MFTKALVCLDGTDVSPGILPHLTYLAKGLDIPLALVSVIDPEASAEDKREAEERLDRFARGLSELSLQTEASVVTGSGPAEEILRQAERQQCDLIAIAAHDRNLLAQAVVGSVTNEVVRSSLTPVLAITPEKRDLPADQTQVTSILVPLDGSSFAESVLPYVEFLARRLSLGVVLLRVLQYDTVYPPIVSSDMAAVPHTAEMLGESEKAMEEEIVQYLNCLAERLDALGLDVRWEVLRGPVSSSIADLAQELPYSIITLSSHGRSGLSRWVLGSVAEELLRGTGNPVLVIPSTLAEDEDGGDGENEYR